MFQENGNNTVMFKLSIITINYNNSVGLHKTIDSVASQTNHTFEYIVVDGGSTDGSVDIILQYADKISRWVSEPDSGIYNAMNKGVKMAHGEYIMFLNSGDTLHDKNVIEHVMPKLKADICVGNMVSDKGGRMVPPDDKDLTMSFFIRGSLAHPSSFTRRVLLERHPFREDSKILGDREFFMYALVRLNASYQKLEDEISVFDTCGISSTQQLPDNDKKILSETESKILPPRVKEDFNVFMGKRDDYHRLFYELSFSKYRMWIYKLVVIVLKIVFRNKGFISKYKI